MRHPGILGNRRLRRSLRQFFPSTCEVLRVVEDRQSTGQILPVWQVFKRAIRCRRSAIGGKEFKRVDQTIVIIDHKLALQGCHTDIDETMRIQMESSVYDIQAVTQDSERLITWVLVNTVTEER